MTAKNLTPFTGELCETLNGYSGEDERHLDVAWEWLCNARKNAPPSADIWDLRLRWPQQRSRLLAQLRAGNYRLSAMQVVGKAQQVLWSAQDALVQGVLIESFFPADAGTRVHFEEADAPKTKRE